MLPDVRQKQSENQILVGILRSKLRSGCRKTYRIIEKTGKIVLKPLKYIDFAYVTVYFTVKFFYWSLIPQK